MRFRIMILFVGIMFIFTGLAFAGLNISADDHGNSSTSATSMSLNSTKNGNIERGGDYDYFKVQVTSSGTLTVYTTGSTDTYGYLNNSSNTNIAYNDDASGSSNRNFKIVKPVSSGTYYIAVRHYSTTKTGVYTLNVNFTASTTDDHGNSSASATSMSLNSTKSGNIERGGDYDYFKVQVTSSGTLTVYTTGSTDTYGYLKNSSSATIAENDDGADRNFKIARSVSSGTYYVAVRHYNSTGTGAYTLNVNFSATAVTTVPTNNTTIEDIAHSLNNTNNWDAYRWIANSGLFWGW